MALCLGLWTTTGRFIDEIVAQDSRVVKSNRARKLAFDKDFRGLGIVCSSRDALRCGDIYRGYRMVSRVSSGIRVSVKLLDELNLQGGFFCSLPNSGRFQTLTIIDETARQSPALGKIFSLY